MGTDSCVTCVQSAPAVRPHYDNGNYWDDRYGQRITNFDWFFDYAALRDLFQTFVRIKDLPCLHIGCGNSTLQNGLADDGFDVCNVDISQIVIDQKKDKDKCNERLEYRVADCRHMPEFSDGCFGSCIDKGVLDAVVCSTTGGSDAKIYFEEVYRTLHAGGTFCLITLGLPESRINLIQRMNLDWHTCVVLLPKPTACLKSEASITGRQVNITMETMKDKPVQYLGPFELEDVKSKVDGLELRDYFYMYVLQK